MKRSDSILSLDADSLLLILEFSHAQGYLGNISATCRQVRELSMPVLFEQVYLLPSHFTQETFVPESIRQHVRTIEFTSQCQFLPRLRGPHGFPVLPHPVLEIPDNQFLLDALRGMGRLRILIVNTAIGHGLPFYILNAILSTPQLECVQLGPSICILAELDPSFPKQLLLTGPAISLTSFRRTLPSYERYSEAQEEADLLGCLFNEIHHTLQIAEMPSDTAPLKAFAQNDWPCLRELVLRGGSQRKSSKAMIEILGRMPNLRILKLELAQRTGEGPHRVCPPGWVGGFPWPELEVLTVSYPHPDDELYALLPNSLLELTLRCFPRHYVAAATGREGQFMRRRMDDSGWCSSLPSSAQILGILRRCGSSLFRLRYLDIEFEESEEDVQLLRHITTAFSTLTFFQFLRYHKGPKHHRHTASWADLGHALAPLTHLRLLRVHLDLEHTSDGGTIGEAISALARPLNPTVRFICSLTLPPQGPNDWNAYRILRDPSTGEMVALEDTEHYYARIDGYSTSAEWTAYYRRVGIHRHLRVVYPPH